MGGLIVTFGARKVRYFREGELVRSEEPIGNFDELEDRLLAEHPRMRRILVNGLPGFPLIYYYLHWSDGTDLRAVDKRVERGNATDADFAGAVVGEALHIPHLACGADLRAVVLDVVMPLFPNITERVRAHRYQPTCPACGEKSFHGVLEFIG